MTDLWIDDGTESGISTYRLREWSAFYSLVEQIAHDLPLDLIWRGQRDWRWPLSPSLDRLLVRIATTRRMEGDDAQSDEVLVRAHLERFQLAARGRRGANPPPLSGENDWWALGQHYGLATPLLDWTRAPFAAAYFAFEEDDMSDEDGGRSEWRVVYGLVRRAVLLRNHELHHGASIEGRPPVLEFYEPMSDENPRLVAQGGVFTRAPLGMSVEEWVTTYLEDSETPALFRILIPCTDRTHCLRALNRMNINHLSLFPDLGGASRYVNLALEDPHL